jgi:large subunit ribosomal protein L13
MQSTSTTHVRAAELPERWLLFDASHAPVGRLASRIAMHLMGKDQPAYTPSELTGAHVVVVNAEKAVFTGKKEEQKSYDFYSGYAGGLKTIPVVRMRERRPEEIVALAVRRMLPKSTLGKKMYKRLKVYAGADHPHTAQKPTSVDMRRS